MHDDPKAMLRELSTLQIYRSGMTPAQYERSIKKNGSGRVYYAVAARALAKAGDRRGAALCLWAARQIGRIYSSVGGERDLARARLRGIEDRAYATARRAFQKG